MSPASALTPSGSPRLPAQPTPLVGREGELATIHERLAEEATRLLTLTGPAGVGKTRLALAAAAQLAEDAARFPEGVVWVDLTPIRDPDLVLGGIAAAVGLLEVGARSLLERLEEALTGRRQLVVLDNFEQVLPAGVDLAALLSACADLTLLVTSRVPLRLRWEQALRVAPLPVPDPAAPLPPLEALLAVPSVELFVGRAQARRPDFALTAKQAPLVARLAAELDGLPLALELAAARLDVLSLSTLTRRLGNRLQLLASQAPDRPERQRSLEAAVGWSYDLLNADEQRLFRCLGVFVGRVSLSAIAAVAGDVAAVGTEPGRAGDERRAFDRLVALAEQSLILPLPTSPDEAAGEGDDDAEPAFGMLETVREYAEERLAAAGELDAARRAHARFFTTLAERADPQVRGRDQRSWYFHLEREHDNLRAALRWLLDQDGPEEREAALRLTAALGWFWFVRGYHAEGQRWLEEALARASDAAPALRARALVAVGALLWVQAECARARAALEEGLALAEQRQDPAAAAALTHLGECAVLAGEVAEGIRLLEEALRRWEALGDPHGLGLALFYRGFTAAAAGDDAAAAACYTDSLQRFAAAGEAQGSGFVHCYFGVTEWRRGDLPRAVAHIRAGVRTSMVFRDRLILSYAAQATAALVGAHGEPVARARLLGATDALAHATGATVAWEGLPGAQDVAELRERLERGEGEEGAAYWDGRGLPFGEVAAVALTALEEFVQASPQPAAPSAGAQTPDQRPTQPASLLSVRETEVVRLVAEGLSSKEIGRQLFLATSTVNYHLTSIFNKLGVDTRAQAVAVAARRNLL
jgi:predicted ATPase/DNA-binding CsgD family transcriptional regulator